MAKSDKISAKVRDSEINISELTQRKILERKVFRSYFILFVERLWPAVWPPLGIVLLFLIISLTGIWSVIPALIHEIALYAFGFLFVLSFIPFFRIKWPARKDALKRLEKASGLKHNPIISYEDSLGNNNPSRATRELWEAHRRKLSETFRKLKTGRPAPRVDRHDPFAIRVVLVLTLFVGILFTGNLAYERIQSAFIIKPDKPLHTARLDAWITPPPYTGKAPIILRDGSKKQAIDNQEKRIISVPENSEIQIRIGNPEKGHYKILTSADLAYGVSGKNTYETFKTENTKKNSAQKNKVIQYKKTLKQHASIKIQSGSSTVYQWQIYIEDDVPPRIKLIEPVRTTIRSAIQLEYILSDDYGIATASAEFSSPELDSQKPENKLDTPLGTAPEFSLILPGNKTRTGKASTYRDLTSHPWAGLKTLMTLKVKDVAGQTAQSRPRLTVLPQRRFRKPMARALIEQRRKLVQKPHSNYYLVMRALNALSITPERFIKDPKVYLGIRSAYWRMRIRRSRDIAQSVVDQLWDIARYIEDGNLSEAERQMKLAQQKLSESLQNNASGEEIRKLLAELRETVSRFLENVAKKSPSGEEILHGTGNQKVLTPQDLDQMLRNIEELAKSGSRDLAAKMLAELRQMLENINTQTAQQNATDRQTMKALEDLGRIISKQQKLLDKTYSVDKNASGKENKKERDKVLNQNKKQLSEAQEQLRNQLQQLNQTLRARGMPQNENLSEAGRSMEKSVESLTGSKLKQATQQQTLTLNKLRRGAQSMTNQLMRRMGQPMRSPGRRDPFGRPSPNNGPDFSGGQKLIDKVNTQRAREILQELRDRYSNSKRPPTELDYLERLLQRF